MDILQLNMFDGKVCGRCQIQKPTSAFGKNKSRKDGLQSYCTECRSIYDKEKDKEYYYRDIEKSREESRRNYYQYRDKIAPNNRKRVATWKQNNPDKVRASYERNASSRRLYSRQWYLQNKDRAKAIHRRYKKINSTYINSINQARRARQKAVGGTYTADQWQQLCTWFGNVCLACGLPEKLTVDHVVPLNPGLNTIDNLQPLCLSCNSGKRRRVIDYRDPGRLAAFLEHIQCLEPTETYQPLSPDIP